MISKYQNYLILSVQYMELKTKNKKNIFGVNLKLCMKTKHKKNIFGVNLKVMHDYGIT